MPPTAQVTVQSDKFSFTNSLREDALEDYDENTINDVESLKQGTIKISKNKARAPYTILLVGETGVGKSSVLELIANVVVGNDIDHYNFDIPGQANEQGGSNNQSQTNSARFHQFTSNNGMVVRILDTPGLADTRGIQQDELHKKSIVTQIEKDADAVTAVLVLANGTVPHITVGTDYALSTLSTIFPKSFASNIAFMFTNVSSPLHWNFSGDTIPSILKDAPQFSLDNPIAYQKRYVKTKGSRGKDEGRADLRKAVKAGAENALEMFVELFDWLDSLEPQKVEESVSLHEKSQEIDAKTTNILAQMDQATKMQAKIDEQKRRLHKASEDMEASLNSGPADTVVWKQQRASSLNYLCTAPNCHSTCRSSHLFSSIRRLLRLRCRECAHPHLSHSHTRHEWVEVINAQTLVAEREKKRWEAAKEEKENSEADIATSERALSGLNHAMGEAMDDLIGLVEDYGRLSLAGGFSKHVEKAMRLLEERYTDMEKKRVSKARLNNMQDGLDVMGRKLELLIKAEEKGHKGM